MCIRDSIISRTGDDHYYYRLYSDREKLLLTGHSSTQRTQCIHDIRQLYASVHQDHHYRMQTAHGKFYFQITNLQHIVVATSIMYRTMAGMAYGIDAVKKYVRIAVIKDDVIIKV